MPARLPSSHAGLPVWHRLRYNGNTSTRGNDRSRACDKSHPLERESLVSSPDISDIINDSLYSEKTLFVLPCRERQGTEPGAGHAPQDLARRKDKHHAACAGPLSRESQLSLVGTSGPHALYQPYGGTGYPRVGGHCRKCVTL